MLNGHQCDVQRMAAHIWLTFPLSYFRDLRGEARQTGPHRRGARIQLIRRQGGARAIDPRPHGARWALCAGDGAMACGVLRRH